MVGERRKTAPSKIVGDTLGTMERLLNASARTPGDTRPSTFKLQSPILEEGSDRTFMAATNNIWVFVNTYAAESGENRLHSHTNEDHTFIVLMGVARFFGPDGGVLELKTNEGILLPRGSKYTFRAVGGPLVLLRVGCVVDPARSPWTREDEAGEPLLGNAAENNARPAKFARGQYYG